MFCVGDKIVHPMHGAGVIESIVDEKIGRDLVRFYVFRMPVSGLTLKIPTANSEMIGVRAVSSAETIERVLAELPKLSVDMTTNWNHRYRENMERIKSGDLLEVARRDQGADAPRRRARALHRRAQDAAQRQTDPAFGGRAGRGCGVCRRGGACQCGHDGGGERMKKLLGRLLGKGVSAVRPTCTAILAAAGSSQRMGGENKLLLPLDGMPVLAHTLRAVDAAQSVDEIVIAAREEDLLTYAELCKTYGIRKPVKVVVGGATRQESVLRAALEARADAKLLAVQDGARPLVTPELFDAVVLRAAVCAAAAPAVPVHDTIKLARDRRVTETPDRSMLFAVQTPQVFDAGLLKAALQSALTEHAALTDDCSAVERLGKAVYLTDGDEENIKITTPLDLIVAETILRRREEREAEE